MCGTTSTSRRTRPHTRTCRSGCHLHGMKRIRLTRALQGLVYLDLFIQPSYDICLGKLLQQVESSTCTAGLRARSITAPSPARPSSAT